MFSIFKARREDATYLKWTLLGRERGVNGLGPNGESHQRVESVAKKI